MMIFKNFPMKWILNRRAEATYSMERTGWMTMNVKPRCNKCKIGMSFMFSSYSFKNCHSTHLNVQYISESERVLNMGDHLSLSGFFLFIYYNKTGHLVDIKGGVSKDSTSSTTTLKTAINTSLNPYEERDKQ